MTVALAVLLFAAGSGCATPEQRYRVLSFFFDGVPGPGGPVDVPVPAPVPTPPPLARARAVPDDRIVSMHEPACDECHLGRHSNRLRLPREELCFDCHDREDFEGEFVHGPVAAGLCVQCHTPHKSRNPALLLRSGRDLCEMCHDQTTYAELEAHREEKGEDCVECHNPHAAAGRYMLEDDDGEA